MIILDRQNPHVELQDGESSRDHLGQREDGDLVLRVVGQVLVQVGQAGWITAELVIHHPQLVPGRALPAGNPQQKSQV